MRIVTMLFHGTQITVFDPRWATVAGHAGLATYEAVMDYSGPLHSDTLTTRVYHLDPRPDLWPGGVYLKKFIYSSWCRCFLRPAKANIEVRNYRFLRRLGLSVPAVLAAGQRRTFGSVTDAFLITAGIENARPLDSFVQDGRIALLPEEITEILDQLADVVGTMHRASFFHIDLQWQNVLIQQNASGQGPRRRVFLIDCPRGGRRWFPLRSWNGRMHDLAGLDKLAGVCFSPKDRVKWFKQYAGIRKLGWQDRLLIRWILRELASRRRK